MHLMIRVTHRFAFTSIGMYYTVLKGWYSETDVCISSIYCVSPMKQHITITSQVVFKAQSSSSRLVFKDSFAVTYFCLSVPLFFFYSACIYQIKTICLCNFSSFPTHKMLQPLSFFFLIISKTKDGGFQDHIFYILTTFSFQPIRFKIINNLGTK